ncbi:LCP family protein [Streptomyces sp. NPDC003077]|uniref:LCP family protein n=1 Tax=Streptomyces sp. NPDC003077 TaxID=3154443 RepID=UPI00339DE88E
MTAPTRPLPHSPAAPAGRRSARNGRSTRNKHRRPPRPRWGLRVTAGVSLILLTAGGVGHALVAGFTDGIARVDPFSGMNNRPNAAGESLNFLVVGTDARDRLTRGQRREYHLGGAPCHCTDTVMLVHLSADRERASVVSLPRDSYAEAPGHTDRITGRKHRAHAMRLNAAYAEGGPGLTVRTVEHMTGVHIDHYLEVDFTSFMKTVDAVGGVRVCTSRPMKDDHTGLDLPAGGSRLNGGQALQYVRSRHIDGASDLSRMHRQQRFLAALVHKISTSGMLTDPAGLKKISTTLLESVRADKDLDAADLLAIGRAMHDFTPASSEFVSVPIADMDYGVRNFGSTVKWNEAKARALFRAIREDRPLAVHRKGKRTHDRAATAVDVDPRTVRVQVDNGTHHKGLGNAVDKALRTVGFATTGKAGSAPLYTPRTVITYDPRWDRSAHSLAAALPGARLQPTPGQGPRMRVMLGAEFRAVHPVRWDDSLGTATGFRTFTGDQAECT